MDRVSTDQLTAFDHIIDVRTPSEFALDHVPGASNYPVLSEAERALVGTIYKQESTFEAKKIGAALVAHNIATYVQSAFQDMPRSWRPLIYCWRGGKRSGAMTHILREIGWDACQLDGGYKAYRRLVVEELPRLVASFRFRVVCGLTGSGKSRLLRALDRIGAQVLDLEHFAAHKGSVLGSDPSEAQPSQKMFESRIWSALRKLDPGRPVYVESESKKVGNLRVPEELIQSMWTSQCIWIEATPAQRLHMLKEEYAHFLHDPEHLIEKLNCLRGLYGTEVIEHWSKAARARQFDDLVTELLERHYDPAYTKSIHGHYSRLGEACRGEVSGTSIEDFEKLAQLLEDQP